MVIPQNVKKSQNYCTLMYSIYVYDRDRTPMQKRPFVEVADVIMCKISFIYSVSPHSRLLLPGPPVPANLSISHAIHNVMP